MVVHPQSFHRRAPPMMAIALIHHRLYNISIIGSGGCGLIAFNSNLVHTTTE